MPKVLALVPHREVSLQQNQLNMWRKTVFGCFIQIGSYVSQIALGRFARNTSESAAFMVTMSALVFQSRALVAFSLSRSLLDVHVEKSRAASTSFGKGKYVTGYGSFVKKEYRSGDAAQKSMFIVVEAGVFCVCEQRHM